MFIQGDLQAVFDALYTVGAIDPVLKMDWSQVTKKAAAHGITLQQAMMDLNACRGDRSEMVKKLNHLDSELVQFIAVEVAREFAEFADRKQLH